MDISFSIVTTTYNRISSGYLDFSINAVRNQKKGPYTYEHIVVDDGSSDNTEEYIKKQMENDSNLKYVKQENKGPAKATKRGLEEATGDFVIIIDDDDALTEDSLYKRYQFIKNNPSVDWFYAKAMFMDGESKIVNLDRYQSRYFPDFLYERNLIEPHVHAGTPTVKRGALLDIEWPEWLERSQDYFLWLELMRPEKGLKVGFLDDYNILYRVHNQMYSADISSTDKKWEEKQKLNMRIKELHPENLVFMVKKIEELKKHIRSSNESLKGILGSRGYSYLKFSWKFLTAIRNPRRWAHKILPYRVKKNIKKIIRVVKTRITFVENKDWGKNPLISIVVDSGNKEALDSIEKQNINSYEIINNEKRKINGKYVISLSSGDSFKEKNDLEKIIISLECDPNSDVLFISRNKKFINTRDFIHPALVMENKRNFDIVYRNYIYKKNSLSVENLIKEGCWGRYSPSVILKNDEFEIDFIKEVSESIKTSFDAGKIMKDKYYNIRKYRESKEGFININQKDFYRKKSKTKPRIMIVLPWFSFGGVSTLVLNYTKELRDIYEFYFVTGEDHSNEWEDKFRDVSDNIYKMPEIISKDSYYCFINNLIKNEGIDIVHLQNNSFMLDIIGLLRSSNPKLKIAATAYNEAYHLKDIINHGEYIDYYCSDNSRVEGLFKKEIGMDAKVHLIPNGIDGETVFSPKLFDRDFDRKLLGLQDDDIAVFFIGRLSKEKGPNVFLDVAKKLSDNSKIKFFMVGSGPMDKEIESGASRLNNLELLGYQTDVAKYLSISDVFVLPSSIEGFPLSILEAMAMESVIIASKVGAIPDIIEHDKTGYVVEPGSFKEISEILISLNNDRKKIHDISRKAKTEFDKKYSNKILKKNYDNLYKEILK